MHAQLIWCIHTLGTNLWNLDYLVLYSESLGTILFGPVSFQMRKVSQTISFVVVVLQR